MAGSDGNELEPPKSAKSAYRNALLCATIARNRAIPTRFSRCELSKLLHRSTFGKKGICPQITFPTFLVAGIHSDTESRSEQGEHSENRVSSLLPPRPPVPKTLICVNLRQSLSAVTLAKEDAGNCASGCGWPRWESCEPP